MKYAYTFFVWDEEKHQERYGTHMIVEAENEKEAEEKAKKQIEVKNRVPFQRGRSTRWTEKELNSMVFRRDNLDGSPFYEAVAEEPKR